MKHVEYADYHLVPRHTCEDDDKLVSAVMYAVKLLRRGARNEFGTRRRISFELTLDGGYMYHTISDGDLVLDDLARDWCCVPGGDNYRDKALSYLRQAVMEQWRRTGRTKWLVVCLGKYIHTPMGVYCVSDTDHTFKVHELEFELF